MDLEKYKILKLFLDSDRVLTPVNIALLLGTTDVYGHIVCLYRLGYLRAVGGYIPEDHSTVAEDTKLQITQEGKDAARHFQRGERRMFWASFRSWLAIGISLVSLALSIISLLLAQRY